MGSKKVFVSYSSKQGEWVLDRLVPCLKAEGAEVLVDRERFVAGIADPARPNGPSLAHWDVPWTGLTCL